MLTSPACLTRPGDPFKSFFFVGWQRKKIKGKNDYFSHHQLAPALKNPLGGGAEKGEGGGHYAFQPLTAGLRSSLGPARQTLRHHVGLQLSLQAVQRRVERVALLT